MKRFYTLFVAPLVFSCFIPLASAQVISIQDPNLDAAVRAKLRLGPLDDLTWEAMQELLDVVAWDSNITHLNGLQHATNLEILDLTGNQISDLGPLVGLTNLRVLSLERNRIKSVISLARLTGLRVLELNVNQIDDITFLGELTELRYLNLSGNQISELLPLTDLEKLKMLNLFGNQITDITSLAGLKNLEVLNLGHNQIRGLPPLTDLTKLVKLNLQFNQITSTTSLTGLKQLEGLNLAGNQISGLGHLYDTWPELKGLNLAGNQIRFDAPLAELRNLEALNLRCNEINNTVFLENMTKLEWLDIGKNHFPDPTRARKALNDSLNLTSLGLGSSPLPYHHIAISDVDFTFYRPSALRRAEMRNEPPHLEEHGYVYYIHNAIVVSTHEQEEPDLCPTIVSTQDTSPPDTSPQDTSPEVSGEDPPQDTPQVSAEDPPQDTSPQDMPPQVSAEDPPQDASSQDTTPQISAEDTTQDKAPLISVFVGTPLYWVDTESGTLHNLRDAKVENLVPDVQNVTSLVVDAAASKLYWTEKTSDTTGKIWRANLDGSTAELVQELTSTPFAIVLDAEGGKLYLLNAWGKIQRMNLDGTDFQPNFITGLEAPAHITIAIAGGKLYWTEKTGDTTGRIRRANLDGSNIEVVKELTSVPLGIAIDTGSGKLYLANAWGKIQRMNLDGSGFQPNLITGLEAPKGIALEGDNIYWIEGNRIRRASRSGENIEDVVTGLSSPTALSLGIAPPSDDMPSPTDVPEPTTDTAADINNDGVVNIQDLVLVASNLGKTGQNVADVNADEIVDIRDLVKVAGALGNAAAAPSLHLQLLQTLTAADVQQWLSQAQHLDLTDITSQRGIRFLEQLLATLMPKDTTLLPNYPNPFNPETWIPYQLAKDADVQLLIYDARGVIVRHLALGYQSAGYYTSTSRAAYWDGRNGLGERVASGVYFYQLLASEASALRKMVILK